MRPSLLIICALAALLAAMPVASSRAKTNLPALQPRLMLQASGSLVVEPDGSASEVAVDTVLSDSLRTALLSTLAKLHFEPLRLQGQPVRVRTAYQVVLAGEQLPQGMRVKLDSIDFHPVKGSTPVRMDGELPQADADKMPPPRYPGGLERAGVMGEVRIAIRIGADGHAEDVAVVRSMLFGQQLRGDTAPAALNVFEQASVAAARKWTFKVPTGFAAGSASDRTAVTSIVYLLDFRNLDVRKEGQWLPVLDAPARAIAWLPPKDSSLLADAAPASGNLGGGGSFRLSQPASGTPVL